MMRILSVDFSAPANAGRRGRPGAVTAVAEVGESEEDGPLTETDAMTANAHPTDPPGSQVYRLRRALGWSQRRLADACIPPLDHTTVHRVERGIGYTSDTLERLANAFSRALPSRGGRPAVTVADLFLPPELADWAALPQDVRARLALVITDVAAGLRRTV